ncbi:unnamed protein product, partial [Rotaria sp. Silwood1]
MFAGAEGAVGAHSEM